MENFCLPLLGVKIIVGCHPSYRQRKDVLIGIPDSVHHNLVIGELGVPL